MTDDKTHIDLLELEDPIEEVIRATLDAMRQAKQLDSTAGIREDLLDYSLRGVESFNIR